MIDTTLPLIGPAVTVLAYYRALCKRLKAFGAIAYGPPGTAKSTLLDVLALEITGHPLAVEQVNGQSLTVEMVREWKVGMAYGNLFSKFTVKRIDEFDCSSAAARNELLSLLDYLKPGHYILATTNDYEKLRADGNRRIESRFKCMEVNGPSPEDAAAYLGAQFQIPPDVAAEITKGAMPDGDLGFAGVNMRLCVEDAQGWLAAQELAEAAAPGTSGPLVLGRAA